MLLIDIKGIVAIIGTMKIQKGTLSNDYAYELFGFTYYQSAWETFIPTQALGKLRKKDVVRKSKFITESQIK